MQQEQTISRLGMFTASGIWQLCKSGRKKDELFGEQAMTYINTKIAEIVTGESAPQAKSASMDWGNMYEKDASMWLDSYFNINHKYYGKENFVFWQYNAFSGGSPDGETEDSVVEFKCPYNSANHIKWLLASKSTMQTSWLKENHFDYYCQVQFNMLSGKKPTGIIASYDPRTVEPSHRMALLNILRDEDFLSDLDNRINKGAGIISDALKIIF